MRNIGVCLKTSQEHRCHLFDWEIHLKLFQKHLLCLCLITSFSLERVQLDAANLNSIFISFRDMYSGAKLAGVDVLLKTFLNVRSWRLSFVSVFFQNGLLCFLIIFFRMCSLFVS